jgi:hypothetical protein
MSFGALSEEASQFFARGAEMAGTGICSEKAACWQKNRPRIPTWYELASHQSGWNRAGEKVQAFHFSTVIRPNMHHLPGDKVQGKSPKYADWYRPKRYPCSSTFPTSTLPADFR